MPLFVLSVAERSIAWMLSEWVEWMHIGMTDEHFNIVLTNVISIVNVAKNAGCWKHSLTLMLIGYKVWIYLASFLYSCLVVSVLMNILKKLIHLVEWIIKMLYVEPCLMVRNQFNELVASDERL